MNISHIRNPVEQAYGGGESVNINALRDAFLNIERNFSAVQAEYATSRLHLEQVRTINARLMKFIMWLHETNPQILDEFQSTANALEALQPRSEQDVAVAQSSP